MAKALPFVIAFAGGGFAAVGSAHLMDPTLATSIAFVVSYVLGHFTLKAQA